jgi:cobalt/nickel transport system permease protein
MSLSETGLWGAWNILVKGTLGVAATSLLGATTTVPELVGALERLRMPRILVAIISFMVRYMDVVTDEMRRMRIARLARGHDPRWIWQAQAVAKSAGALFIRSFERGERVHLAMLSRGYDGRLYRTSSSQLAVRDWMTSLMLPATALSVCLVAVVTA